ncbi:hypothetical protein [Burkholderia cepacia]|nr:hypothetical protein [Burkholderia cepacia]
MPITDLIDSAFESIGRDAFPRIAALRARLADDAGVRFAHAVEESLPLPASSAFEGHVSLDDVLASVRGAATPAPALRN